MAWTVEEWMIWEAGEEVPEMCPEHGEEIDEESGTCLLCVDEAEAEIHREWDARYHFMASHQPIEFAGMAFDDMAF